MSVVQCLIANRANVNAVNEVICFMFLCHSSSFNYNKQERITPLHIAAQSGDYLMVQCLIQSGANVNAEEEVHCFESTLEVMLYLFYIL